MAKKGDNDGMQNETARVLDVHRDVLRKADHDAEQIFADLRASLGAAPVCRALREAVQSSERVLRRRTRLSGADVGCAMTRTPLMTARSASTLSPSTPDCCSSPASASCGVRRARSCPPSCASRWPSSRRRSKWA